MYKAFFGLTKNPFGMSPDAEFLFLTPRHREAIAGLTYAITERKGFLALSGPVGTGKTTVLTWVLERLTGKNVATSVMLNPVLTPDEFLEAVLLGFGITEIPDTKPRRLQTLEGFLSSISEAGNVAALVVDEAHKLTPELLEEIRLMGNFERGGEKLLQILLIGQNELDDLLNRPDLSQLKQRICVRLTIGPLDRPALDHYVHYRWTKAGGQNAPFPQPVLDRLFHWSGGIPRLVNSLSDNALTLAFAENQKVLRVDHIDAVAKDLRLVALAIAEPVSVAVSNPVPAPEDIKETAVRPIRMATLERYDPPKTASLLSRWAGKFGWA